MRIAFGTLARSNILTHLNDEVRPTSSMTTSVIFNTTLHNPAITTPINDAIIADLCCGTGLIGFNFISLGAKKCYFIDINRDRLLQIKETAKKLSIEDKVITIQSDLSKSFNIDIDDVLNFIFVDPPYDRGDISDNIINNIHQYCDDNSIIILENGIINRKRSSDKDNRSNKLYNRSNKTKTGTLTTHEMISEIKISINNTLPDKSKNQTSKLHLMPNISKILSKKVNRTTIITFFKINNSSSDN